MSKTPQVIVLAGVGDLGRYVCEELLKSTQFDVVILTRGSGQTWFKDLHIPVHKTDYTVPSLLTIFNDTYATAVISFVNDPTPTYVSTHAALLGACGQSNTCKRLIPSEWIGNSESYPLKPDYYATSREPFRQLLKQQTEVEWTLLNTGWLADYFLPKEKTHMKPVPLEFPVDPSRWRALVRGTGDDLQSWTCARDVGRAVVELCKANEWETHTYVAGEWNTFNTAITTMESFYGRSMPRTQKTLEDVHLSLKTCANIKESMLAQMEEVMVMGCMACPPKKTMRQRETYFKGLRFLGLEDLLRCAEESDFV